MAVKTDVKKRKWPKPFKPVGFKPEFDNLFDEWKATARQGLPSRWIHPIKFHYWRRWNLLTHFGRGTSTEPWIGTNYLGPSREITVSGAGYGLGGLGANRKPATKTSLKKLDVTTYDSLLFV